MRIITDIEEARALLTRRPSYVEPVLGPAAARRTKPAVPHSARRA